MTNPSQALTLEQALQAAIERLAELSPSPQADAERLLLHVLQRPRSHLFIAKYEPLDLAQAARYAALIAARAEGMPVAYLTGEQGFWDLDLKVTPATLIPRPETERLVELALATLTGPELVGQGPTELDPTRVLDLGTGSGAIALAIAKARPDVEVTATDLSGQALAVARENAERLGLNNLRWLHGRWFEPLAGSGERFALIVSNPPYIRATDAHLAQGDLRFEPRSALAAGADGLDDIRQITHLAPSFLAAHGSLLIEHGWDQGAAVAALFKQAGLGHVSVHQDLESRDRVTSGVRINC